MAMKSDLRVNEFGEVTKLSVILKHFPIPAYQVAALAGMPQPRLSEYTNGKKSIPAHHLIALSEVLNMDPQDIVGTIPYEMYTDLFEEG